MPQALYIVSAANDKMLFAKMLPALSFAGEVKKKCVALFLSLMVENLKARCSVQTMGARKNNDFKRFSVFFA